MDKDYVLQGIISVTAIIVALIAAIPAVMRTLKLKKVKHTTQLLVKHPFFSRAEITKHHIGITFRLENKGKEAVFKDAIANQISIFQKRLYEVCVEIDRGNITDSQDLLNAHIQALDKITFEHYNYYLSDDRYTKKDKQVLDIVMKKYVIWNKERIEYLHESIRAVCGSPYYADTPVKAAVIMDLYMGVMVDTINDACKTLGQINGDLNGLTFKNVKI